MNWTLAAIRLSGIGPQDARFDPFAVELTDPDAAHTLDTVLWLTNGGGKTVLLRLLFTVLAPAHVDQIGVDDQQAASTVRHRLNHLGAFLRPDDVGHVILEWRLTEAGRVVSPTRLVTGLVAAARPGKSPAVLDNIRRLYYSIRSDDGTVGAADLPLVIDEHRLPFGAFREALDDLARVAPARGKRPRVSVFEGRGEWLAHLDDLGLDRQILAYQVRMNRGESSANNLLTFGSDRDFIRFLLDTVIDPEAVSALDASVAAVSGKVAHLQDTEREYAFVTAVIERLDPLADTVARSEAAAAARREAERTALALRDALAAAAVREEQARTDADAFALAESGRAGELRRRETVLEGEIREFRLAKAEFEQTAAEGVDAEATAAVKTRRLEGDAWALTADLERLQRLDGEIGALASQVAALQTAAQPLRVRRDAAARGYRDRLVAEAVLQREVERGEATSAAAGEQQATEREGEASDAAGEARAADERRTVLERERTLAGNRRDAALRSGVVRSGETAREAQGRVAAEILAGTAREAAIVDRRNAIAAETAERVEAEQQAAGEAAEARAEASTLERAIADADGERVRLAGHPVVVELAGAEHPDLELVGEALVERLAARADAAGRRRVEVAVRGADDRRAVRELAASGLLPAPVDVAEAVTALDAAGIAAIAGAHYLARAVSPDAHAAIIAARPELVAGVVLTGTTPLAEAEAALAEAGLEPATVLVLADAVRLVEAEGLSLDPADRRVLPPPPALHDPAAADGERERRERRVADWDRAEAEAATAASDDRILGSAIAAHLEAWPAGRLEMERQRAATLAKRASSRQAEARESAAARGLLRDEERALAREARELATAMQRHAVAARDLERLVEDEDAAAERAKGIERLRVEATDYTTMARELRAQAAGLRHDAGEAQARSYEARGASSRALHDAAAVALADTYALPTLDDARRIGTGDPLATLKGTYETLDAELRATTTESPAAERLTGLRHDRATLELTLERAADAVVERARIFLASPEGIDPERRRAAAEAARAALESAIRQETSAHDALLRAQDAVQAELDTIHASSQARPQIRPPADRTAADLAIAERTTERNRVADEEGRARAAAEQARLRAERAALNAQLFSGQRSLVEGRFTEPLQDPAPATPYAGAPDTVADTVGTATAALDAATRERSAAEHAWRAAWTSLSRVLTDERYADLAKLDLARRVASLATDPAATARIAHEVHVRADRLRDDMESLRRNRELLVRELAEATDRALREIGQVERRSKLPEGLHEWTGHPFLQIAFERPGNPEDLTARLTAYVVDLVKVPAERRPTGAALLLEACSRAIVGDFRVRILKPNDGYALRYVPIEETAAMSNGQRATAAMCLLMILSAVRAKNRTKGVPGVGALFLDNPFGNASAGYLVGVQRSVAAALGIQPVYTTGVKDYDAIAPFTNKVALANDQARGRMLRYVHADPELLERLASRTPDDGHVTSARVLSLAALEP